MNWIAFLVAAWVAFGLEMGLKSLLSIGKTEMAPSIVLPLAVYVAMHASPRAVFWTCLAIGLTIDLTSPVDLARGGAAVIAGPHALGLALGGQLVISLRGMLIRDNFLTLGVATVLAGLVMHLMVVAIFVVHRLYGDPVLIDPAGALARRTVASLYSGGVALGLAFLFRPLGAVLGFPTHGRQRFGRY